MIDHNELIRRIGIMGISRMTSLRQIPDRKRESRWRPLPSEWEEVPVSIERFFTDFYPEPLFPKQKEFADAMFGTDPLEWNTKYIEGLAYWGKGSGKDHSISKLTVYAIYWMMCLRNPQQFFRMGRDAEISIANVSINARLAKDIFFKIFKNVARSVINPRTGNNWFEDHGSLPMRDGVGGAIHERSVTFPKNIACYSLDSEVYTGEGLNLFIVNFDEVGGFRPQDAEALYTAMTQTQASRFPKGGFKTLLFSFKRSDNDFMNIRYKRSEKDSGIYRSRAATWEVNINVSKDDPAIQRHYLKDPEQAKMTYECSGEVQAGAYYKYKKALKASFNQTRDNPLKSKAVRVTDISNLKFEKWFIGNPSQEYFIHIDLATGKEGCDCAGFCMLHMATMPIKIHKELMGDNNNVYLNAIGTPAPGIFVDACLQIKAPPSGEILFEGFHYLVKYLRDARGFNVSWVTYDGWQSTGEIQRFESMGLDSEVLSVDRRNEAHDCLKGLIYSGRFDFYYNAILLRELGELIKDETGKITHPDTSLKRSMEEGDERGSKDVADAAAGASYKAVLENGGTAMWFEKAYQNTANAEENTLLDSRPDVIEAAREMSIYKQKMDKAMKLGEAINKGNKFFSS